MSEHENLDKKNIYLDAVAEFLIKHMPEYASLSEEALTALEKVWLLVGDNRGEFIKVLNILRKPRKK